MKKCISLLLMAIMVAALLAPCAIAEEQIIIRAAWWGGVDRNNMMNEIYDLYESEHPNVKIEREYSSWDDYWIRYSTQVAGNNAPDVIQFTDRELASYVALGAVEPLDAYVESGALDVSQYSEAALSPGIIDGKMYEIAMGLSTPVVQFNKSLIERCGIEIPDHALTWAEFEQFCISILESGKLPEGAYVLEDDGGRDINLFLTFLREKGYDIINENGEIGFTAEVAAEWFGWWNHMREIGVVPPYSFTAEYEGKPKEERAVVMGTCAIFFESSNQAKIYQRNMTDELGLMRYPSDPDGASEHGECVAGAYLAVSINSEHKDIAIDIINFFVNDERANRIFKAEQGIPGNVAMQQAIADLLHPLDNAAAELLNETMLDIPALSPRPNGTTTIITSLLNTNQTIAYGAMTVEEASEQFVKDVVKALRDAQ